ncbi:MAG: hypothetical protein JWM87_3073, partial [Candidatus Eremiobacteraeota bacterium]|nr:hypothetical protein [Candidatus Eremiobacteraeota bacterium]
MNVRFLAVSGAPSLRARYGDALAAGDAAALAANADARVLAVDGGIPAALRELLRESGAAIAVAGATTLLGTTRAALERARDRALGA